MPRPPGRPPDNLLAQLRAWALNPATGENELKFFEGFWHAVMLERNGGGRRGSKSEIIEAVEGDA